MCPSFTKPARWQNFNTCTNSSANAVRCCLRKSLRALKSGRWFAASTRKATSGSQAKECQEPQDEVDSLVNRDLLNFYLWIWDLTNGEHYSNRCAYDRYTYDRYTYDRCAYDRGLCC